MPIETEDGLGTLIDVSITHEVPTSAVKDWTTNYQFASIEEIDPSNMQDFIDGLGAADAIAHNDWVDITKGNVNRHIPKTTQPLGDTVTYNPTNHVEIDLDLVGMQGFVAANVMPHDTVIDFIRNCEFGNPGKIEVRGLLTFDQLTQDFGGYTLTVPAELQGVAAAWAEAVLVNATAHGLVWVLAGEPQLSKTLTVVSNRLRVVRTFGETIIRAIVGHALGKVRADRNDYRYFDVAP